MKEIANGMPFINDEKAIGKWDFFDIVSSQDDFSPNKVINSAFNKGFKEIYFLPEGEKYWIFEGWTKGYLLIHYGGNEPILTYKYNIKYIDGSSYMFIEINEKDETYIEVLKKVSERHYKLKEIGRRENINIPFVFDEKIIGSWNTVGFVDSIDEFYGNINLNDTFWLRKVNFYPDGQAVRKYSDEEWHDKWSKGVLLDSTKSTVSQYTFKTIDSVEYMFLEWKMGNYVYGGMPPSYYVLKKETGVKMNITDALKIQKVDKDTDLADKLICFVKNFSWEDVKEHTLEMLRTWAFTDWETPFAAIVNGQIVGMAFIMKTDYYPLPKIYPWVSCIFVTEEYRGYRISEKLIDFANEYAKKIGFDRTYIPTEHIGLYEKYGYRYLKDIVNYSNEKDRLYVKEIK